MNNKLFLDDDPTYRPTPGGYDRVYTAGKAIAMLVENLSTGNYKHVSLDHDLGVSDPNVWSWLRYARFAGNLREATDAFLSDLVAGKVTDPGSGDDVALWLALAARDLHLPRMTWHIHSANPTGRGNMERNLHDADLVWNQMDF